MKTALKYGFPLLCCLLSSRARAQTSCTRPLAQVGPVSADNGFPLYYVDANQLALAPCLDTVGLCPAFDLPFPTAPVAFPGNFPAVSFYSLARAVITLPNGGGGRLVLAVEGSFPGGVMTPGTQFAFSRLRIRVDGLVPGTVYTFTHPYGVDVLQADDLGSVNVANDAGTAGFTGPLAGPVGPFLVWDASPPAPPPDTIGTPAVTHRVTGSPCGTNFFRVDGPGLPQGGVQTDLFSVAGLKTGICGNGILDTFETCDDGNQLDGDCCSSTCQRDPAGTACAPGRCVGTPRNCNDSNVCTDDSCNVATGCVYTANTAQCDDGNACTTVDVCSGGRCVGSAPPSCDDGNPCTDDSCNPTTGCVH